MSQFSAINKEGLELIKKFEGFSAKVYPCSAGKATIGIGHLILPNEKFTTITEQQAIEILNKDLKIAIDAVNSLVTTKLTHNQFSALVSFIFNLGSKAFRDSTLRTVINTAEHLQVPEQLVKWKYAGGKPLKGLLLRRLAEATLYLS